MTGIVNPTPNATTIKRDQSDVGPDLEDPLDVGAGPVDEELERSFERREGDEAAGEEQDDRRRDEADRVPLLGLVERRDDEPPELPQQHRQRQDDAAVERNPEAGRQPFDRIEEDEADAVGRAVVRIAAVAVGLPPTQVTVRLDQPPEHRVVERDHEHGSDQHGEPAADDPHAQLGEMFEQAHRRCGVGLLRSPEPDHRA